MCETSSTDDLAIIAAARETADTLLGALRVPVAKALDLATPRGFDTAIAADLNAIDHRTIAYVTRANALFVRDEYGRRLESFGEQARRIVARGLEQGLGRDDIAEDLAAAADVALIGRSRRYWDVVAASFIGEGRSLSQISAYAEARIDRYVLLAILD